MSPDNLAVWWPPRDEDRSEDFVRRVQDYLRRLEGMDSRFAHLAWAKLTADATDLPPDRFHRWMKKKNYIFTLSNHRYDGDCVSASFGVGRSRTKASGIASISASAAGFLWRNEDLQREVLKLGIEFWRGDDAGIYQIDYTKSDDWLFWLRWQRDGVQTPIPNVTSAGTPSSSEPWLDGILRTWPEHAPRQLLETA